MEIARQIVAGDVALLEQLMRRYNQKLYRTARSILKDDAESEDAVQEAYVRAYRAMDQFRAEARLSTWLVRIVAYESIARVRKRNRWAKVIDLNSDSSVFAEQNADTATYLGAVPVFGNRDLSKAAASILGDEAMHWAILRNALGEDPVPTAFMA